MIHPARLLTVLKKDTVACDIILLIEIISLPRFNLQCAGTEEKSTRRSGFVGLLRLGGKRGLV